MVPPPCTNTGSAGGDDGNMKGTEETLVKGTDSSEETCSAGGADEEADD